MLRIGITIFLLALAACSAPATSETATSIEDAPGIRHGSQDGSIHLVIQGDAKGPGGAMQIDVSRPIVFSVGGIRVENEPLISTWTEQVGNQISKHGEHGLIRLSQASVEEIVQSIPLPPDTELRIKFDPAK